MCSEEAAKPSSPAFLMRCSFLLTVCKQLEPRQTGNVSWPPCKAVTSQMMNDHAAHTPELWVLQPPNRTSQLHFALLTGLSVFTRWPHPVNLCQSGGEANSLRPVLMPGLCRGTCVLASARGVRGRGWSASSWKSQKRAAKARAPERPTRTSPCFLLSDTSKGTEVWFPNTSELWSLGNPGSHLLSLHLLWRPT